MIRITAALLFIALAGCLNIAKAQTAQDSVKQTINQLFRAMKEADGHSLEACFADSAVLQLLCIKMEILLYVMNK